MCIYDDTKINEKKFKIAFNIIKIINEANKKY